MKEFYLLLMRKYKKIIVTIIILVTLIGFILQSMLDVLEVKMFLITLLSIYACICTWCNGILAESLPINELSTNIEVISRWVMITTGTLVHLWILVVPFF